MKNFLKFFLSFLLSYSYATSLLGCEKDFYSISEMTPQGLLKYTITDSGIKIESLPEGASIYTVDTRFLMTRGGHEPEKEFDMLGLSWDGKKGSISGITFKSKTPSKSEKKA